MVGDEGHQEEREDQVGDVRSVFPVVVGGQDGVQRHQEEGDDQYDPDHLLEGTGLPVVDGRLHEDGDDTENDGDDRDLDTGTGFAGVHEHGKTSENAADDG